MAASAAAWHSCRSHQASEHTGQGEHGRNISLASKMDKAQTANCVTEDIVRELLKQGWLIDTGEIRMTETGPQKIYLLHPSLRGFNISTTRHKADDGAY
jgi:hypothetical protein